MVPGLIPGLDLGWANEAIGVVAFIGSSIFAALRWAQKKSDQREQRLKVEIEKSSNDERHRIKAVEEDVLSLDRKVEQLGAKMTTGMATQERRVEAIERTLETVARQADVANLNGAVREFRGAMTAEMRAVAGQVDTMYKAALAASQGRKPDT